MQIQHMADYCDEFSFLNLLFEGRTGDFLGVRFHAQQDMEQEARRLNFSSHSSVVNESGERAEFSGRMG